MPTDKEKIADAAKQQLIDTAIENATEFGDGKDAWRDYRKADRRKAVEDFLKTAAKTAAFGPMSDPEVGKAIARTVSKKAIREMAKDAGEAISEKTGGNGRISKVLKEKSYPSSVANEMAEEQVGSQYAKVTKYGPGGEIVSVREEKLTPATPEEVLPGTERKTAREAAEAIVRHPWNKKTYR